MRRIRAIVVCGLWLLNCSTRSLGPRGPAPEYEPPVLPPWDAGSGAESSDDPFAAAAEGDWISEPADDPASDGSGVRPPGDADAGAASAVSPRAADGGQAPSSGLEQAGRTDQAAEK